MTYPTKPCCCALQECNHEKEKCNGQAFGTMAIWTRSHLEANKNGVYKREVHVVCAECFWKHDKEIRVDKFGGR